MTRTTNPAGYVRYNNEEYDLKPCLEIMFFPTFFDIGWKLQLSETKEVSPCKNSVRRIDYFGIRNKKPTWVEVKNWWVTTKDMQQINMYNLMLAQPYDFFVICGGIARDRQVLLEGLKIQIILTKDIKELDPKELVHWM